MELSDCFVAVIRQVCQVRTDFIDHAQTPPAHSQRGYLNQHSA